ncbi:MAG: rubrerythrin family protein [Euryarchaeota archaeon]|nr:rubrerythrin family protein [Euryarchaeota archaeon]
MRKMTEANVKEAFAGESQAHMKYLAFADKADGEGFKNVARLFRAAAFAEQVHATNHFVLALQGVKDTKGNLRAAIEGETYEIDEMYPAFIEVASLQEEARAEETMTFALATEKAHAKLYGKAEEAVARGKDAPMGKIQVCSVCGYTLEGEAPAECPVCGSPKEKFRGY